MKKDKTRTPAVSTESEQVATLRTKQERHERLSREHAASARRVWLRRILLKGLSLEGSGRERRHPEPGDQRQRQPDCRGPERKRPGLPDQPERDRDWQRRGD